jgi:hypothetical protein
MKKKLSAPILALAVGIFLVGCATNRVNWDARIGAYTYDQAVVELGPPDKQAKLTDNQTVAEWISRYATGGSVGVGTGFYSGGIGGGVIQTTPIYRESKLCLIFSTNHILTAWSRK